ncbi:MAG: hypothetical protein IKX70_06290 [Treponema sp.]|nr:hypothetical protein [Treponema sp.]
MNKYYFLQIKEGSCSPYIDTVHKWIKQNQLAAIFSTKTLNELKSDDTKKDQNKFVTTFDNNNTDGTKLISIGQNENHIETVYIYEKAGLLNYYDKTSKYIVDPANYSKTTKNNVDNVIGFPVKLIKEKPIAKCPLVLATMKSNQWLTRGTFKEINPSNTENSEDDDGFDNSYFGNIKAIEYVRTGKKQKVQSFLQYLECLSPIEFETLVAKIKEAEGFFVPAYKGGSLKDYDIICRKKNGKDEYIQVKLNLYQESYNKYMHKHSEDLHIYCVSNKTKKTIKNGPIIYDWRYIEKAVKKYVAVNEWLITSLDWIDFVQ